LPRIRAQLPLEEAEDLYDSRVGLNDERSKAPEDCPSAAGNREISHELINLNRVLSSPRAPG